MLFDLVGQFVEFVFEVFAIQHNFVVLFTQLGKLFLQSNNFLFDGAEFTLVIFSTHLMLLKLPQQTFKFISL